MRTISILLVIVCLCLGVIAWKLFELSDVLKTAGEDARLIISSNQALINANARLENELAGLRKQVEAVKDSFPRK
ncbi:MAG: hypothetical protein PHT59_06260 [Candidatus Omnitrophica bacterium]|nr:hypothetical protein [Candidatus Omnitrophota bacterium]